MGWKAVATGPAALAVLLTLGNAAKPPVVDDTAYLLFARQIAAHPLDPYGFELFWYQKPEPAMTVLAPPALPYWLALGIGVFGERPVLLKLWLFPVCWLFCRSAWALFARFAPGWERPGTTLVALGPAALPLVNFMLDVPAAAFALAAVAAFVHGCEEKSWSRIALAGPMTALAMQTKYSALTVPVVFAAYALARGRFTPALVSSAVAAGLFTAWELFLVSRYGESHFVHHLADQAGGDLGTKLEAKWDLYRPLVAQLGGLAACWGLVAAWSLGVGRRWLGGAVGLAAAGLIAVATVPQSDAILLRNGRTGSPRLDLASLVYMPLGYAVLATGLLTAARQWRTADGRFLVIWLAVELGGYFALTPFPACRRVIPTVIVLGLLVGRAVSYLAPARPPVWLTGFGVACGVGLLALDTWDARVEPALATRAANDLDVLAGRTVWTQGHWGWQYATDRRGWRLVDPGRTRLVTGDWLVLPVEPDPFGFYRPYHGGAKVALDPTAVALVTEHVWDDRLAGQTVPNLYGGVYPVVGRDHPRLRLRVYRVVRDWAPATAGTPGTD